MSEEVKSQQSWSESLKNLFKSEEKFDKSYIAEVHKTDTTAVMETQKTIRQYQWIVGILKIVAKLSTIPLAYRFFEYLTAVGLKIPFFAT